MVVERGSTQVLALFLEHGLRPDVIYQYYHHAEMLLHVAIRNHHYECVRLLLEHGADPNFICSETRKYLEYAEEEGTPKIYELLREHGALTREERYAREHAKSATGSASGDRWFNFWLVVIPTIIAAHLPHVSKESHREHY